VQESFEKFLDDRRKSGARDLSIKSYQWKISLFVSYLGEGATIDKINQGAIDGWKISMIDNGTASATINSYMKHLKVFLAWLNETYQMEIRIKSKPLRASDDFKYIPDDIFESICNEANKIHPLLDWAFRFYRSTGARLREIYNGVIYPQTIRVSGDKSKGHNTRVIPLAPGEAQRVQELRESYSPENLSRIFHKCSIIAGTPFKFHSLRHTCAVLIYIESKDIMKVKHRLGHSTLAMSEKYTHFDWWQLQEDFPLRFESETKIRMAKSL
jgi:integrase